jgi:putative oxidoreductase
MRAYGPTLLRLCVGTLLAAHGIEQLLGAGGAGLTFATRVIASFGAKPPYPLALAAAAGEVAAGALLVAGVFTLWVALILAVFHSAVFYKVFIVTRAYTLTDPATRASFELSLLVIGALIALAIMGPGALSMDERKARSAERASAARARMRSR